MVRIATRPAPDNRSLRPDRVWIRTLLENYYPPGDLEAQIAFASDYNHMRFHEPQHPGRRHQTTLVERERIKQQNTAGHQKFWDSDRRRLTEALPRLIDAGRPAGDAARGQRQPPSHPVARVEPTIIALPIFSHATNNHWVEDAGSAPANQ